jgi:hypothetical protein
MEENIENIEEVVQVEQEVVEKILARQEYADLLLYYITAMVSAISTQRLEAKEFKNAIEITTAEIQSEMIKTGEGSILPEQTLKKIKTFAMFIFNEYNRIKNDK